VTGVQTCALPICSADRLPVRCRDGPGASARGDSAGAAAPGDGRKPRRRSRALHRHGPPDPHRRSAGDARPKHAQCAAAQSGAPLGSGRRRRQSLGHAARVRPPARSGAGAAAEPHALYDAAQCHQPAPRRPVRQRTGSAGLRQPARRPPHPGVRLDKRGRPGDRAAPGCGRTDPDRGNHVPHGGAHDPDGGTDDPDIRRRGKTGARIGGQ